MLPVQIVETFPVSKHVASWEFERVWWREARAAVVELFVGAAVKK